ncbi:hypothetical protein CPB83DRAFT_907122 [Crepidotus variabilis]|uniref:Uncharacterized protein n=1 Tax=Crepidotus variabilis TaxID=179855 RepID=A0A9P6JPV1_9AGAR|nr:hypothetical protein CPB83DRAFT_907122 [Crepidotus variabilis]
MVSQPSTLLAQGRKKALKTSKGPKNPASKSRRVPGKMKHIPRDRIQHGVPLGVFIGDSATKSEPQPHHTENPFRMAENPTPHCDTDHSSISASPPLLPESEASHQEYFVSDTHSFDLKAAASLGPRSCSPRALHLPRFQNMRSELGPEMVHEEIKETDFNSFHAPLPSYDILSPKFIDQRQGPYPSNTAYTQPTVPQGNLFDTDTVPFSEYFGFSRGWDSMSNPRSFTQELAPERDAAAGIAQTMNDMFLDEPSNVYHGAF